MSTVPGISHQEPGPGSFEDYFIPEDLFILDIAVVEANAQARQDVFISPEYPVDDSTSMHPGLLQAALDHATEGWRVFPLRPQSKVPRIKGWRTKATTDCTQIRRWWTQWPDSGIGGATGYPFIVADVDDESVYDLLTGQGVMLPPTRTQNSARGRHHIYKVNEELGSRGSTSYYGRMDLQGAGKIIVLAPSLHPSGIRYRMDETPYAEAPRWLRDHAGPARSVKTVSVAQEGVSQTTPGRRGRPVPLDVGRLLNDPTDHINDKALRDGDRSTYRDRSGAVGLVVGLLRAEGWSAEEMFEVLKVSTLICHYEGRSPEKLLMKDIKSLIGKNLKVPRKAMVTVAEHRLAATGHSLTDSQHKILEGHYRITERVGRTYGYAASRDDILLLTGVSRASITTANRRLVHLGLLVCIEPTRGGQRKSIWALAVPKPSDSSDSVKMLTPTQSSNSNPTPCVCRGQNLDVLPEWDGSRYRALGQSWTVLSLMCPIHEQTVKGLGQYLGRKPPSIRHHLRRLVDYGVIVRTPAGYLLHPNVEQMLEDLAVQKHTDGSHARDEHMVAMRKRMRQEDRERFKQREERRRQADHSRWGLDVAEQLHQEGTISDQSLSDARLIFVPLPGQEPDYGDGERALLALGDGPREE